MIHMKSFHVELWSMGSVILRRRNVNVKEDSNKKVISVYVKRGKHSKGSSVCKASYYIGLTSGLSYNCYPQAAATNQLMIIV